LYDIIIKDGLVIDPSQKIHSKKDVAISDGKIEKIGEGLDPASAKHTIDASNKIVTPGLIDLHVHAFSGVSPISIEPDEACLVKGVTTILDAGSSDPITFPIFKRNIIDKKTNIFALINLNINVRSQGLSITDLTVRTIADYRSAVINFACQVIESNREVIKGVKWRHPSTKVGAPPPQHDIYGLRTLLLARECADVANCILMCEAMGPPLRDILDYMDRGDVLTHSFHGWPPLGFRNSRSILDRSGKVLPEVWEAIDRGVFLDVGHGVASFSFRTVEKAMEQGLKPHTISTDLHAGCINGPTYDLPTTMSKFLALGFSLDEVVEMTTLNPSKILRIENIGTLREGSIADVTILDLLEGDFIFYDTLGESRIGHKRLVANTVIRNGNIVKPLR